MKISPKLMTACSSFLLSSILLSAVFCANAATVTPQQDQKFAIELFKKVSERKPKDNVLVSPLSASLALGMVLNGAGGDNKLQMCRTLGTSPEKIDQFNARNKTLIAAMNANKDVTLEVASAIYSDKKTPFKQSFIDFCKSTYSAAAQNLDFAKKVETLSAINGWCAEKTHGKIPGILSDLKETDKMVLLNAIYFKGKWAEQFSKAASSDHEFTLENGKKTKVKMMYLRSTFRYFEGDNFAAVALPYRGGKQSMYVFLPNRDVSVKAFQSRLSSVNWKKWMASFSSEKVSVELPKLKVEFQDQLNDTLEAMGMKLAFQEGKPGLFSGLVTSTANAGIKVPGVDPNLEWSAWISKVIQKTYMEVSEEGTEAAAVTAVVMGVAPPSYQPMRFISFSVDRPYVLALVDEQSGEIMFMGKILNPAK